MNSSFLRKCAVGAVPALLAAASFLSTAPVAGAMPSGDSNPPVGDAVPAASAATPSADWAGAANGPCKQGSKLVGAWSLRNSRNVIGGEADLYWNNTSGQNCLVVRATGSRYGARDQTITAYLATIDHKHQAVDSGKYRFLAGPVYVPARRTCVDVAGTINVYANGRITDTYRANANHVACS